MSVNIADMFESPESRWDAVRSREPAAISSFVYGVITTRIFCRPTCHARLPRKSNVLFYNTIAEATSAGFRACKRCKPEQDTSRSEELVKEQAVRQACEIIESTEGMVTLKELATQVQLSPRYLHGSFKTVAGVTPGLYAKRIRARTYGKNCEAPCSTTLGRPCLEYPDTNSTPTVIESTPFPLDSQQLLDMNFLGTEISGMHDELWRLMDEPEESTLLQGLISHETHSKASKDFTFDMVDFTLLDQMPSAELDISVLENRVPGHDQHLYGQGYVEPLKILF